MGIWTYAVDFIQVMKSIIDGFTSNCPQLWQILQMSFMVTLVLSILKSARYSKDGD